MPRLSILIPVLGNSGDFEDTLASVLQHRPDDCEVIVAHARPYDDPYKLSGEVCFIPRPGAWQKIELLNAGFEAARSGIIHVVQCGLAVAEGWTDAVLECFADEQLASIAPVIVDADAPRRIVAAGQSYSRWGRAFANSAGRPLERRQLSKPIIGPTLAAGFYRRSWWRLVRWDEALGDDFADAHFNLALAKLGAKTALLPECIVSCSKRPGLAADEPYGFVTARRAERLFWSHSQSGPTAGVAALRAALALTEAVLALPSPRAITGLLGRIVGLLDQARPRAFRAHLEELAARLATAAAETEAAPTLSLAAAREKRARPSAGKRRAA